MYNAEAISLRHWFEHAETNHVSRSIFQPQLHLQQILQQASLAPQ